MIDFQDINKKWNFLYDEEVGAIMYRVSDGYALLPINQYDESKLKMPKGLIGSIIINSGEAFSILERIEWCFKAGHNVEFNGQISKDTIELMKKVRDFPKPTRDEQLRDVLREMGMTLEELKELVNKRE